jgi:hypothetical protein
VPLSFSLLVDILTLATGMFLLALLSLAGSLRLRTAAPTVGVAVPRSLRLVNGMPSSENRFLAVISRVQ